MQSLPDGLLEEVVKRLVAEFQPERVILFGSHAWGEPHKDSDLDLMVIVPETEERAIRLAQRGQGCMSGLPISTDVLVRDRYHFYRYAEVRGSLEYKILAEGRILYDGGQGGIAQSVATHSRA